MEEAMEVRSAIQQIALEHRRRYGYRRVSAELRHRGMLVNHKRVARIMREDNLLAVQPRQFVVTTDSNHALEVYLNLASRMKLSGINQLWVADITYIRLQAEFVYLAVILDAYSRKVVGWALGRTLASRLAIAALEQAIRKRQPPLGVVHHSDRGVQYASDEYVAVLEKHGMIPSMSRPANPPSPSPDLIPARNRPRDGSIKSEIVSMEGATKQNGKCANQRLSQPRGSPHRTVPEVCHPERAPERAPAITRLTAESRQRLFRVCPSSARSIASSL